MKTVTKVAALAAALASITLATSAVAEERVCNGAIGPIALDNIFVPDGATCMLDRTRANGSVVVGRGAQLVATGVSINGNIQAEGAASVTVRGHSMVGGSVQIVQGYAASIERVRIKGDLYLDSNAGPLSAISNIVGGNLQAFQNKGGVQIFTNRIDGNLQCKENEPAPVGAGNRASSKEDQCSAL
jgi:hypothetical protein